MFKKDLRIISDTSDVYVNIRNMCMVGTCPDDGGEKKKSNKKGKVVKVRRTMGPSFSGENYFPSSRPLLDFGPKAIYSNKPKAASFDDACSKLDKQKLKKKKLKEIAELGKRVDFQPSYFACLLSKNVRKLNSEELLSSFETRGKTIFLVGRCYAMILLWIQTRVIVICAIRNHLNQRWENWCGLHSRRWG